MSRKPSKRKQIYQTNKLAKVGDEITCPICGEKFIKKQYSQAFCCSTCKDAYWNAKKTGKRNDYYREYNEAHPERYERIGLTPLSDQEKAEYCHPFSEEAVQGPY